MDSDPPPRTSGSALTTPRPLTGRSTELPADSGEDPYSSGSLYFSAAPLLGLLLGLITLVLPLASVITDRQANHQPAADLQPTAARHSGANRSNGNR